MNFYIISSHVYAAPTKVFLSKCITETILNTVEEAMAVQRKAQAVISANAKTDTKVPNMMIYG
jgi:hypothetical protein